MLFVLKKALIAIFYFIFSISVFSQSGFTVPQAIKQARLNNLFLQTEKYNIGISQSDVITSRLRPNLILNNQTLQSVNSKYFARDTKMFNNLNRQVWWQLTKSIQWVGQKKYGILFANQKVDVANKNFAELERNLAIDVANKWIDVWLAKVNLDLLLKAQSNVDSLVQINKFRLKNQVITSTDLIRTELISDQYELQIKNVKQTYANEIKNFKFLLGASDSAFVDVDDPFQFIPESTTIDSLINYSLSNRTDILVAKSIIATSETNIELQKALSYPKPEVGIIYNPQNSIPYIGFYGTVQLPVFNRNQGERQKAGIIRQQAEQSLKLTRFQINTEVTTAYNSYIVQKSNLEKNKLILQKSENVLNTVRYAYLRGGTTIIDFLEAQRSWYDTRLLYYTAIEQYRRTYVQLLYATGLITQL